MSGGSYNYMYQSIHELASMISENGVCDAASKTLRKAFKKHLELVAKTCRAIEWNDSGDGDSEEEKLIKKCLGLKKQPIHRRK
jgi:hypothetical protein